MRKAIYYTIVATIALFFLQGIWIYNMYQKYIDEYQQQVNNVFLKAIESEVGLRGTFKDPKNPKLFSKRAKDMTPEERASHKGEIVDLNEMQRQGVATSMAELFAQMTQDSYLKENKPPRLSVVDSLLNDTLAKYKAARRIYLYNKEGKIVDQFGSTDLDTTRCFSSVRKPIGTKGQLFMQLKTATPKNVFLSQMLYLLIVSIAIVAVVLGCLTYQLTVIRRKEQLIRKREASVNGTIHDLKSPLNGVMTLLNWLSKSESDEQKKGMISGATKQVQHLVATIESILISARGERQRIVLHKTEVNLPQLIERVIENTPAQVNQKPHTVEIINRLSNPMILADTPYMENVMKNLIENAIKYSDDGVRIEIALTETIKGIHVTVKDNGWGIPRKYQRKLFTQYYQVPREEVRMQKGYGIGLSYVRYIVRAHGGHIHLTSQEEKGSIFTFNIPRK